MLIQDPYSQKQFLDWDFFCRFLQCRLCCCYIEARLKNYLIIIFSYKKVGFTKHTEAKFGSNVQQHGKVQKLFCRFLQQTGSTIHNLCCCYIGTKLKNYLMIIFSYRKVGFTKHTEAKFGSNVQQHGKVQNLFIEINHTHQFP